jgi:translation initiation factor IF-2
MGHIRINELARELEIKSRVLIECLPQLGVTDKKSHSSALDEETADKVRAHFRGKAGAEKQGAKPSKPAAAKKKDEATLIPPAIEEKKAEETHPAAPPLTRSIAEIKAAVRRSVAPAARPAAPTAEKITRRPAVAPPAASPAARAAPAPAPASAAAAAKPAEAPAARAAKRAKPATQLPASKQPIYPAAGLPKGLPVRPSLRRPGEPRPMHPTASRSAPSAATAPRAAAPRPRPRRERPPATPKLAEEVPISRSITISEGISIKELSEKLGVRAKDVLKRLMDKGIFATINQTLDSQTAGEISRAFGAEIQVISFEEEVLQEVVETDKPEDLKPRAPVVTVMGHVDHGKTSLLDAIRETRVAAGEAGGITQHIGAYQVQTQSRSVVFLDTPGHEAFTLMRARGAKVTDVVILVVAADDGVMPQTLEAINHARAAKVPILVAINKIDKPDAQPDRVKKQLADHGLMPESWGGDTVTVEVSAKQRQNLDLLLEMILLVADMQQLNANPNRLASGTVVEAKLDRGRGPVAAVLVQNGTLHVGDPFIVGAIYGKVRAMLDDRGRPVQTAPPSTPVEVLGLEDVPQAGDRLQVIEDTMKARQIALHRQSKLRETALAKSARLTLEQLHEQLAAGDVKELPLIIKADVQGSVEVMAETLNKLSTEKVRVKVIHAGVGAITESDVLLASTSNAVIVGFNVRPERKASELAHLENVDIRLHTVIYNVTEEIRKAMTGLLAAVFKETTLGHAEVRDTFRISRVGTVAGCYVQDGKITRDSKVRLLRDNVVVYEGKVRSVRRFKEDVSEVKSGMECGIALENYNDIKAGDSIEAFAVERVMEPTLA